MSGPVYHGRTHNRGGTDPISGMLHIGDWVTPTLLNSWTDAGSPYFDFQYRWGPYEDGWTVDDAGIEFRGEITGGLSGSVVMTFPSGDRFTSDVFFELPIVVDGDDLLALAYIEASSGDMTLTWPLDVGAYMPGGTDVALADGGTGTSLTDPNADRIMFWDDSAGHVDWLTAGTGLSISGTTITATGSGGGVEVDKNDVDVTAAARGRLNFIEGSNVTLTISDDGANDEVDITIAASGGGGGVVERDYVEITSNVTVSATTAATANTVITGTSLSYDGSTRICIEFYTPRVACGASTNSVVILDLWDGATDLGILSVSLGTSLQTPVIVRRFLTPSNASHQYIIKAWQQVSNGTVFGGSGGAGADLPAYLRIIEA